MNTCSKCGGTSEFKEGDSAKNGKHWQGFKCQNKDCGNMDFIKDKPGTSTVVRETGPLAIIKPPVTPELRERTMVMSYAKDIVAKKIETGIAEPGDSAHQIIAIYRELMSELTNPLKGV